MNKFWVKQATMTKAYKLLFILATEVYDELTLNQHVPKDKNFQEFWKICYIEKKNWISSIFLM